MWVQFGLWPINIGQVGQLIPRLTDPVNEIHFEMVQSFSKMNFIDWTVKCGFSLANGL